MSELQSNCVLAPEAADDTLDVHLRIGTDNERMVSFLRQLIADAEAAQAAGRPKVA
jgi:hypothetical protein